MRTAYAPRPARSGGVPTAVWVLIAVLGFAGVAAGVHFATRKQDARTASDVRDPDRPDPDRPDRPEPPDKWERPRPDKPDRPDPDLPDDPDDPGDPGDPDDPGGSPGIAGKTVEIAQGVKIIAPPGMAVQRQQEGVIIGDLTRFAIIAGPITESSNDPDALARAYAKLSSLKLEQSQQALVAGQWRKVYAYSGKLQGTPVIHVGVPLLGPGYRVAVIIHMPALAAADKSVQTLGDEVLTRRIIVPDASP